jgi:HD-like signal output (HDOD) protein
MLKHLLDILDNFPPLPQTLLDIEKFKNKTIKEENDLLEIIEKDPLILLNLLKVANSKLFTFGSKVETASKAIKILGINFTIHLIINKTMHNKSDIDLEPYQITKEDLIKASTISSMLANLWLSKIDNKFKNDILLPAFLQEVGKFVLSELLILEKKSEQFIYLNKINRNIPDNERNLLGTSTSKVTAEIFRHWNLSNKLVDIIEFVDDIDNCKDEYKKHAQILDVIKTACNPMYLLSDESIEIALEKINIYQLDKPSFVDSINALKIKVEEYNILK